VVKWVTEAGIMGLLNVGDKAPDFTVKDQNDQDVQLSDFRGKKVILWFYPKADTPG
jgi:thioredoxin-dependent peroxiredoxin